MKSNFFLRAVICLALADCGQAMGYDAPRFERPLCDRDALSLMGREEDEIVMALTALVSNFPDESLVDDDVKEKAMALALCLRPLNAGAREAHAALLAGRRPAPVELFDSLGAISGALWRHGERLAQKGAEPEDRRLAPMLMELSLLTFVGPASIEKLAAFQSALGGNRLDWSRTLDLQPASNPSNERAAALLVPVAAGSIPPAAPNPSSVPTPQPPPIPAPLPSMPSIGDGSTISEIKRREESFIFVTRDIVSGMALAGEASLRVREPDSIEQGLSRLFLGEPRTGAPSEMRLTYRPSGAAIAGVEWAEALIRRKYPRWPDNLFGEFGFQPAAELTTAARVNFSLPALVLLGSAFSGDALADTFASGGDYALAGEVDGAGGVSLPERISAAALAKAIGAMATSPKVLFVPIVPGDGTAEASLMATAVDGADPGLLLWPQVVGYTSLDELRPPLIGDPQEELLGAMADFATVQALADRMEIGAIARNDAVRLRLNAVVAKWPGHLSARALLAYGARPVAAGMTLEGSLKAIDSALAGLADRYRASQSGELSAATTIATLADAASRDLAALRGKIDPQARNYLDLSFKAVDAAKIFLSLNNPGTSIGQQRQRELLDRHAELKAERSRLGFPVEE